MGTPTTKFASSTGPPPKDRAYRGRSGGRDSNGEDGNYQESKDNALNLVKTKKLVVQQRRRKQQPVPTAATAPLQQPPPGPAGEQRESAMGTRKPALPE